MPFHQLSDDQRRALCKAALDSLEIWLRRVIHYSLNSQYGSEYLDARDATSGDKILKREIREKIKEAGRERPFSISTLHRCRPAG